MKAPRRLLCRMAAALCAAALAGCAVLGTGKPQRYTATYWDVFDTVTVLTGYAGSESQWQQQAELVHGELLRYHQLFDIYNTYPGLTNLAAVNTQAAAGPVPADPAILELLALGKELYALTGGKCNVAAGAVLTLWHDAREAAEANPGSAALPDAAALAEAAGHCAIDSLLLDEGAGTVRFADPGLSLDVGAIGKGFAVEAAARAAEAAGVQSMLLNVGGNLRAIGTKPGGEHWTAGVENPWPDQAGNAATADYVLAVALLPGQCLVTSGDYQRYFTVDGERYAHLIDPDTQYPARYVRSVSVLCSDSGLGDGLSTGLFCTDPSAGLALAEGLDGVEAVWLGADGTITQTSGFAAQVIEP